MNPNSLLMPIKTMQSAISSTETVTKGPFNNYVKLLWVDGGFCYKAYNKTRLGGVLLSVRVT